MIKMPFRVFKRDKSRNKRISPKWSRIPKPVRNVAMAGEYLRLNPYPVESIVSGFRAKPFITKQTKIITMGSCFAQELNRWLRQNEYNCLEHKWGVIYSPQSIAQIVQYSFDRDSWNPDEPFWVIDGKYHDPYLKSEDHSGPTYRGDDEASAWRAQEIHFRHSGQLLRQAELVVWTLGLTELWRNQRDHAAYYAVPYPGVYDAERHEFHSLTYEDVAQKLKYAVTTLTSANPTVTIMLSVSPVPLSISFRAHLGPYIATQYSKSILHSAALATVEKYDNVIYMPSYEITRNDPIANYKSDGRHVNSECVRVIMEAFKQLYVLD